MTFGTSGAAAIDGSGNVTIGLDQSLTQLTAAITAKFFWLSRNMAGKV